ncbi:MAG: nucleoside kinase [Clostridia bacterium]|nr:nucleoside kinase [Clostridia bacterium]
MIEELKNKKLKVKFENGKDANVKFGTSALDALKSNKTDIKDLLAVKVNNALKSAEVPLVDDCEVEKITLTDQDGHRVYVRTVKFLLHIALQRLYPNLDVEVCNTIDGIVYFICENMKFTNVMAEELLKEMRNIVVKNSKIEKMVVSYEEAKYLFEHNGHPNALKGISVYMHPTVTIYKAEDTYGLTDGILAPTTGCTPDFEIKKFRRGFVLMLPKRSDPTKINATIAESPLYEVFEKNGDFLRIIGVTNVPEINEKVITGKMPDIVRVAEADHENRMADLMNDIKTKGTKRLFMIAGPSSSGKTTFANKLCINLKLIGYNPIVVSMDNYFKEREDNPKLPNGEYDFETIDALDLDLFNRHIAALYDGKTVEMPEFNFVTGEKEYKGKTLRLKPNDVIVLEGIHALNPALLKDIDDKLKYKIYIAPMTTLNIDDYSKVSTTDTRMLRRIVRDYHTRGHKVERTLAMWPNLRTGETKYIYPNIKYADYIFNTSLVYEIGALKTFAEPLLLQVDKSSEYFSESRRLYHFIQKFLPIETKDIPGDSIVREFIGNASLKI